MNKDNDKTLSNPHQARITELMGGILNFVLSLYFVYKTFMPADEAREKIKEHLRDLLAYFDDDTKLNERDDN